MNMLNSIILEGVVEQEFGLVEPVEGFKYCKIILAVTRKYVGKDGTMEEVSHFEVEFYGASAEVASKKAKKGCTIRVVGRLKQDACEDELGNKYNRVFVISEHTEYKPMKGGKND